MQRNGYFLLLKLLDYTFLTPYYYSILFYSRKSIFIDLTHVECFGNKIS